MKKFTFWAPRILSILFALFVMMFSFDVFEGEGAILDKIIGFIMHNLPTFGIFVVTAFAWKNDWVGAIGFGAITVILVTMVLGLGRSDIPEGGIMNPAVFIFGGPSLLIALLYATHGWLNRKKS